MFPDPNEVDSTFAIFKIKKWKFEPPNYAGHPSLNNRMMLGMVIQIDTMQ